MSLLNHIKKNNIQNVVAHKVAVGRISGKRKLFLSNSSSRHSLYVNDTSSIDTLEHIMVNVISLDDCLSNLDLVHLVKMDCEGAEYDILMTSDVKTLNKIQKLALEIHDSFQSTRFKELYDRLSNYFPNIKLIDQQQDDLGYLYAWK